MNVLTLYDARYAVLYDGSNGEQIMGLVNGFIDAEDSEGMTYRAANGRPHYTRVGNYVGMSCYPNGERWVDAQLQDLEPTAVGTTFQVAGEGTMPGHPPEGDGTGWRDA